MGSSKQVRLAVRCSSCGKTTDESLARLNVSNSIPCIHCGKGIDLQGPENGILIQELAQACARIDAAASKRG
jgi:hypothetical protein